MYISTESLADICFALARGYFALWSQGDLWCRMATANSMAHTISKPRAQPWAHAPPYSNIYIASCLVVVVNTSVIFGIMFINGLLMLAFHLGEIWGQLVGFLRPLNNILPTSGWLGNTAKPVFITWISPILDAWIILVHMSACRSPPLRTAWPVHSDSVPFMSSAWCVERFHQGWTAETCCQ